MADFETKYNEYQNTLKTLHDKIASTEKEVIVETTILTNLEQERDKVIANCEQLAGCSIDKVPEMLKGEQAKLDDIMAMLGQININGEITEDTLTKVNAIRDKYNIA